MAVREFVDGWLISQVLGEGAYGEVQLLTNRSTNESVAVKIINKSKNPNVSDMVRKEVCIHRKLNHPNIIKYFGHRKETDVEYIFMEYASGGELFDRIEPDVGMEEWQAQKYFKQILSGVEYMHTLGIAHRDLKPENLLLDEHDNIKITDFGFATLFRMKGAERLLDKLCGTPPYLAPEVLLKEYYAEPADLWSCGIILVTMLAGELPWDKPTLDCPDYVAWKNRKWHATNPWPKIPMQPLSLIQRLLTPLPSQRCKLNEAKEHRWMRKQFSRSVGFIRPSAPAVSPRPKKHCSDSQTDEVSEESTRVYASQPERRIERNMFEDNALPNIDTDCNLVSFSQPAQFEDLLLSSELHGTQGTGTQNQYQKLVRRMTRFFVDISCDKVLKQLTSVLEDAGWSYKIVGRQITVTSVDKRKMPLTYKLNILDMDGKTLLDFRLSKGCGLEFKRRFLRIKASLGEVVLQGPVTWPIAVATHTVP